MNENAKSGIPEDLSRTMGEYDKFDRTEMFPEVGYYKLAVVGAVEKFNRMKKNRDALGYEIQEVETKLRRVLSALFKIPVAWPELIPKNWENFEVDIEDAEGWIDYAVKELDEFKKFNLDDLLKAKEKIEEQNGQIDAVVKIAGEQQKKYQEVMKTLTDQVELINEQKQIINAAQAREDETLALKVQLDSMSNLCQKYARENKKLKKAKK